MNLNLGSIFFYLQVEEELKVKFNYKRLKQALFKLKKYKDITKANTESLDSSAVNKLINFFFFHEIK